jgi:hypothetical protein
MTHLVDANLFESKKGKGRVHTTASGEAAHRYCIYLGNDGRWSWPREDLWT